MKRKPPRLIAFDTEDDSKGRAFLFNFYDVEKNTHHTFKKQIDALDFSLSQTNSNFWAVNLQYDINNLFRGYFGLLRYTFAGSRVLMAETVDDEGKNPDKIKFFDTLNHWMFSVSEMGRRIGLPKLDIKHTGSSRVTKKMVEYCKRDTEITGRFVKSMRDVYHDMGCKLKMTIASTTLDFFERNYYGTLSHRFTEEQIDFFHRGYYGGRTEIFYTKPIEGEIFYHDINSLYPAVLEANSFPDISSFRETSNPDFGCEGMVEVEIIAPNDLQIPYLPHKKEGKLIFPVGEWSGVYTYFEIREALKLGYKVRNVKRAIEFSGVVTPFVDFIGDVYEKRKIAKEKNDELLQMSYKNLMNYCYGKFAQGNEITKLVPLRSHKLKTGDTIMFDLVLTKEKEKYPRYANCIWACYCTAYARHVLYTQGLIKVLQSGAVVLYCDTDSVLYENAENVLGDSKDLGRFKLEGKFEYAHFKLPKLYALRAKSSETIYRTKGVPRKVSKEFFETGKATFRKPNKLRETLRRNLSPSRVEKIVPNFWELREKTATGKYDKRTEIGKTGFTKPLVLKDLQSNIEYDY